MLKQKKEVIHKSCFLQLGCWVSHTGNSKEMAEGPKWSLVEDEAVGVARIAEEYQVISCLYLLLLYLGEFHLFPVAFGME